MKGIHDAQSKAPIDANGYLILRNMLSDDQVDAIKAESLQIIADAPFGVEDFGGRRTSSSSTSGSTRCTRTTCCSITYCPT